LPQPNADSQSFGNADGNGNVYAYTHGDSDVHAYSYGYGHIHAYGYGDSYIYTYRDSDSYIYAYRNSDGYGYSHSDGNSDCVAAYTDATASAHTAASSLALFRLGELARTSSRVPGLR
jgi:hypothetical protein